MNTETTKTEAPSTELAPTASLKEVIAFVNALAKSQPKPRDRGPESTREMTKADAERVIGGDLKALAHGKAAEALGLSYGQVYSARLGYTFKGVTKALGAWVDPSK